MRGRRTKLLAGGTVLCIAAAFAAHGAITGYEPDVIPLSVAMEERTPPAVTRLAAAAPGSTGTMPLPDLPVPSTVVAPTGIAAAQPFHLRGSSIDQSRALQCLTTAIYYEAANEPDDGQRAVAQVILNRARHPAFPATVCGVVFQGSDKSGCQFSFACDGAMARAPVRRWWDRAQRVAASALNGEVFAPVGLATHYHTYAVTPAWNRSLVMTAVEGAHFFHRWKGYWGTPAAFIDRYVGGEPSPGPLRPVTIASAAPVPVEGPLSLPAPAPVPAPRDMQEPIVSVRPAYIDSGSAVASHADDSQILDKWKDSGKPLR